ncbi:cell wall metabolism sensor histidine kinase WalK, partial [Klebsiella pneumoniae]|uniref:cell wall metabolism sensor histidine kinase WalK n=1 Tax=Klebsiella pneumoniae TaxID=573 RepID=UPI001D0E7F5D
YRKEYLGNVSHELKTPLFNVQGYISTLLDGAAEEKEILFEYLKKADKNIERMLSIIDDLETISHLESGAMILEFESFDLETLINEVFEQME